MGPPWRSGAEKPRVVGRRPCGAIAMADADGAASAYSDAASDEAQRAVWELLEAGA